MNKEILYLLLLGSLLFLKTNKFKNTMVLWAIFVSSFYLLFMNKESYVNRKESDNSIRTKLYVDNSETPLQGNSIGTQSNPLSEFSFDLRVPETIAFEVLTTDECRQKCEQPSLTLDDRALTNINNVLTNSVENKIFWDTVGTGSGVGNYGNAGRVTMSNFLLSQNVNSDKSISTLTPTVGSLGASLSLYDETQFHALSQTDPPPSVGTPELLGCSACQYGTLEGNPDNTISQDIPDNLGSDGCPASCIWNAWNKCGQDPDNSRKQACSTFDTDQETGIGSDRISSGTNTWDWGTSIAANSDTNTSTQPLSSQSQTPSSIKNISNTAFKPIITSVTRISQGTDTTSISDWSTIINSDGNPSYYSCINQPEGTDSGTDATGRGSCQTSQNFTWFTETPLNTDEASFTNLQRQGDYGYLSFNYSLNIGNCPPDASGGIYEITFELPKPLFCNRGESCGDKNQFSVYIQCPERAPPREPLPEPEVREPDKCQDYSDSTYSNITAYCESKNKMYREINEIYVNNEPESCCTQPDSCSNFDDLNGDSLKDYCKNTFNKYSLPEPETKFINKFEPQPDDIEMACCGNSIIGCFEPEQLKERGSIDEKYESVKEYCMDEPRYSEINSEAEPFEDDDYSDIEERCCGDKVCPPPTDECSNDTDRHRKQPDDCCDCKLYTPQIFYIIIPVIISIFFLNITFNSYKCRIHPSIITYPVIFFTIILLNTTIFPTLLKWIKSFIYGGSNPLEVEDKDRKLYTIIVIFSIIFFCTRLYLVLSRKSGKSNIKDILGKTDFEKIPLLKTFIIQGSAAFTIAFLFIFNETFIDSIYSNLDLFRLNARWDIRKSYKSNYFTDRFSPYIPGPEKTCGDNYNDYNWNPDAIIRDTLSEPQPDNFENYYVNGKNSGGKWEPEKENDNSVYDCSKSHCGTTTEPPTLGITGNGASRNKLLYCLLATIATYWFIKGIFCYDPRLRKYNLNRVGFMENSKYTFSDANIFIMTLLIIIIIYMIYVNIRDHLNMNVKIAPGFLIFYIVLLLVYYGINFRDITFNSNYKDLVWR